ncbi:MAG TPA: phosphoribosylformylglycinamidine synthase subunit PurL [Acidimicrobiia bacterium]|jgi:phosphoribosylformylglycinamidine synthase
MPDVVPLHRQLGMTDDELDAVCGELGREPNELELAMYSVMWSEHCSYKSSKPYLGRLPTTAPWVLVGPGEGAGVIAIDDDLALAVRIESHNHPSAVEPYQGAATGVGGIIRDIFSMGARPIALLDPLRFGPPTDARSRYLLEGVVSGISGYGNAVGVPTVGGEAVFDECYRDNPLVNVMCLGLLRRDQLVLAIATGEDNLAVLLGGATGRDGIGGASVLASAGFAEGEEAKRPSVQVGDPFEEKRLIEACLELYDRELVVGVQDLGAAGLSCAASETAAKGGMGVDVDVARVAQREPGMNAVELLTSESQERMLAIVTPERLDDVLEVARRWEIRATVAGRVTDTGRFRVFDGTFDALGVPGENPAPPPGGAPTVVTSDAPPLADVPVGSLGDGPVYHRPVARPADLDALQADDPGPVLRAKFPAGCDLASELLALLATPTIADKSWIYRQYDHQLFLNTVVAPGGDASVLRLRTPRRAGGARAADAAVKRPAVAISTDGKGRFCRLDPRTGARLAVMEAARNVSCAGATPRALVNCLNFGNPEHPEVMWQFAETIDGMRDACEALELPVVGGNVSFYNESRGTDIDPTPVMGVVGVIDRLDDAPPGVALRDGDEIVLLGSTRGELGGSEWAAVVHGLRGGRPPEADLDAAERLHALVASLVQERVAHAVHDCSDGGLAVALARMAIAGDVGVDVALPVDDGAGSAITPAEAMFAESANRVLFGVTPAQREALCTRAAEAGVPAAVLGTAGGDALALGTGGTVSLLAAAAAWRVERQRS